MMQNSKKITVNKDNVNFSNSKKTVTHKIDVGVDLTIWLPPKSYVIKLEKTLHTLAPEQNIRTTLLNLYNCVNKNNRKLYCNKN